jgi:sugar O-acyltransferase (sialic acid O-acetyltransferase NeuD family)
MSTRTFVIYGAGGHAKIVLDALLASKPSPPNILLVDDNIELVGSIICGHTVMSPKIFEILPPANFHVAIGGGAARKIVYDRLKMLGHFPQSIIHPGSTVSPFAWVGAGAFLATKSVVAPCARVGNGAIVNHGAVVDHDCEVGEFSHIAPNAALGGGVKVGSDVLIGAGSIVLPGCVIANEVVIGGGAVVTSNVTQGSIVVGVPARNTKKDY